MKGLKKEIKGQHKGKKKKKRKKGKIFNEEVTLGVSFWKTVRFRERDRRRGKKKEIRIWLKKKEITVLSRKNEGKENEEFSRRD